MISGFSSITLEYISIAILVDRKFTSSEERFPDFEGGFIIAKAINVGNGRLSVFI
jgi:hypothetical protein